MDFIWKEYQLFAWAVYQLVQFAEVQRQLVGLTHWVVGIVGGGFFKFQV